MMRGYGCQEWDSGSLAGRDSCLRRFPGLKWIKSSSKPGDSMERNDLRWVLALVLGTVIFPVSAQVLYRCPGQGEGGATLIQDRPCPDGRPAATRLDSREVRVSPQRQREIRAEQARNQRAVRQANTGQVHMPSGRIRMPSQTQRERQACESAKNRRDAQRRAVGLNRNYNYLSQLDRQVRAACGRLGP